MAISYQYLPFDISEIFRELVGTVSDNLSDSDLDISNVHYYAETWQELCNRVAKDGKDEELKTTRYPFIALIRNYDSKINANSPYIDGSYNFVIVCRSEPTWLSEKRIEESYTPTLYPIYMEFLEIIKASNYFQGAYFPYPTHTMTESLHLGKGSQNGNVAYMLNDCVDAIIITGLQLKVNRDNVAKFIYGKTVRVLYINSIRAVSIYEDAGNLKLSEIIVEYDSTGMGLTPIYSLYTSHDDTTTVVDIGDDVSFTIPTQDGNYTGKLICIDDRSTAYLSFYYSVYNGVLKKYSTYVEYNLTNFTLTGFLSPYYPFTASYQHSTNKKVLKSIDFDSGKIDIPFDEVIFNPTTNGIPLTSTNINCDSLNEYVDVNLYTTIEDISTATNESIQIVLGSTSIFLIV